MQGFNAKEFSAHSQIVALAGKNRKILEFGCGKGFVSEQLQKNCNKVTAIEIDTESAGQAEKFCEKIILGNIEKIDFEKIGKDFDAAIFADVLEHLKNPEETIAKTKKLLSLEGKIIVSVPNIANWKIRFGLLLGKFDYAKQGILDKTHLKFFTLKTIKKAIENSGFEIEKISSVPSAPVPSMALKKALSKIFPGAFSFQFIILARVKK
ncbi:MAG: class I SAM-dependent methyltransferase [Candidatus ainarchaeum sp.]|nr:class I SAM-dependent methyltransferase [Candidatus ainarchaeum sp.]